TTTLASEGALDPRRHAGQRRVQRARVLPARLGEVGPPAAPAADGPGNLLNELPRVNAAGQIPGDGAHEAHLAVDDAGETDHARAEALADGIRRRTKAVGIETVEARHHEGHALDGPGPRHQLLGPSLGETALDLGEGLLQRLLLVEELLEPARQLEGRDAEEVGRLAQRRLFLADVLERGAARHGLEPADARGHRALLGHLEEADLSRGVEMGPAAQLRGELADPDDPDAPAVLLAEEGHGPQAEGLVEVRLERIDGEVLAHHLVDEALDPLEL